MPALVIKDVPEDVLDAWTSSNGRAWRRAFRTGPSRRLHTGGPKKSQNGWRLMAGPLETAPRTSVGAASDDAPTTPCGRRLRRRENGRSRRLGANKLVP